MQEIILSKGLVALVDDEDYQYLNQFSWYARYSRGLYYAAREVRRDDGSLSYIWMHRVIMSPKEGQHIDHINHNELDNRRYNLRIATARENQINRRKVNNAGYVGVKCSGKKFGAQIRLNGIKTWLGTYDTALEAHYVYMNKVEELKGGEK